MKGVQSTEEYIAEVRASLPERLSQASEQQIDTALARLYTREFDIETRYLASAHQSLQLAVQRRRQPVPGSAAALLAAAHTIADLDASEIGRRCRETAEQYEAIVAQINTLRAAAMPLNSEFDHRGGWTRAFLVTGADGHVHASMSCSTCNRGIYNTQFQWLPEYSAQTEEQIIADAGWRACAICFEGAPIGTPRTLPSVMLSTADRERKHASQEREARRAQLRADRIAKGLTEDGSPFVIEYTVPRKGREEFKTERAAMNWVVGTLADAQAYGFATRLESSREGIAKIEAAIAAKHQITVEQVRNDVARRVAAAIKRRTR